MKTHEKELDVKALCSRKLLDLLKNDEWESARERRKIETELITRRHYLEQMEALSGKKRVMAPSTATRH
ncbi:hypothetical protein [Litorivivens sp.]|uniref:hypothetical protein n=1 Tax=Litorivivens sp. TaxID=2020868 RepID=UPI003567D59C